MKFSLNLSEHSDQISVHNEQQSWHFKTEMNNNALTIHQWEGDSFTEVLLLRILDQLFSVTQASEIRINHNIVNDLPLQTVYWQAIENGLNIKRSAFYQIREVWLSPNILPVVPNAPTDKTCELGSIPVRPVWSEDTLYQRYIPQVDTLLEIRKASIEKDGERFCKWQNDDRVAKFWEYAWSRDKLDAYLQDHLDDLHTEPLIISANGTPFAYVESYWCKEDRLGPYYNCDDFDQGFHLLIGEPEFQGKLTSHFLIAVTHFLFLTDPRTQNIMGEPRADNINLLKYVTSTAGWQQDGEVQFPHKTAALLRCDRQAFFKEVEL